MEATRATARTKQKARPRPLARIPTRLRGQVAAAEQDQVVLAATTGSLHRMARARLYP